MERNHILRPLDRGDGVCRHFNETEKLCGIYPKRPLVCRVDDMYHEFFKDRMSLGEFYQANSDACLFLQKVVSGHLDYHTNNN